MEKYPMCRICLVKNVHMYVVVNENLHELYEKLTGVPFVTEDSRPMLACLFCCAKLKQCWRLLRKCLEAEELFTRMMNDDYEQDSKINLDNLEFFNGLTKSPIVHTNIVAGYQTDSYAAKVESPDASENPDYFFELKEEYQADNLEHDNVDSNYPVVEDKPALQAESDSEDDVPLVKIKTEIDDELESTDLEHDNVDSNYPVVEDKPALQAESDSEDDVPLVKIKTEIDDELESTESPVPLEAEDQWDQYKTMFGQSFINSTTSIDDSFIPSITEVINNPVVSLPSTSSPLPNECPTERMDSEPCVEEFSHESADIIEPSLDLTPMPSPNNDFLMATSTPLFRNLSICDAENSSSGASRSNTPPLSNGSSQESSVCSSSDNTPSARVARRHHRRRCEWKDIKRKCLKNLGKAYLSRNGVQRDGKILKQPCPVTCRLKCFQKFDVQQRERIFSYFWKIGDHCRQWNYIVNHTEVGDTKYPSTTKLVSRRKKSVRYSLPLIESNSDLPNKVVVCKTMFLNTLSVGERTVKTALSKWRSGGGSVSPDRRGGTRTIVLDDEIKQGVLRHVHTFQPVESHYVRKDTSKIYLDSDLTFTKMFSLYNEWCVNENLTKKVSSVRQYRDIINQNLNISFHKPKKRHM